MKCIKRLVFILLLFQISAISIGHDLDEPLSLNPFVRMFNFIIRYVDIPGINLNPDSKYEEVMIIDYGGSFEKAMGQIKLYRSYVDCIEKTETIPMPMMKFMSRKASDADLVNAYGEYVDKIIEYVSMVRMTCNPPPTIKLPVYRKN